MGRPRECPRFGWLGRRRPYREPAHRMVRVRTAAWRQQKLRVCQHSRPAVKTKSNKLVRGPYALFAFKAISDAAMTQCQPPHRMLLHIQVRDSHSHWVLRPNMWVCRTSDPESQEHALCHVRCAVSVALWTLLCDKLDRLKASACGCIANTSVHFVVQMDGEDGHNNGGGGPYRPQTDGFGNPCAFVFVTMARLWLSAPIVGPNSTTSRSSV